MKTFTITGSHGELTVETTYGLIIDRVRWTDTYRDENGKWREIPDWPNAYDDIAKFDLAEWRAFYPGEEPDGMHIDILDMGFWTNTGEYCAAEFDFREEIRLAHAEAA